jgi:hypothetical protein
MPALLARFRFANTVPVRRAAAVVAAVAAAIAVPGIAAAEAVPAPTYSVLSPGATLTSGGQHTVYGRLMSQGHAVTGVPVTAQEQSGAGWKPLAQLTTDSQGVVRIGVTVQNSLTVKLVYTGGSGFRASESASSTFRYTSLNLNTIPSLAKKMVPVIENATATECPALPPAWVVAEVDSESGWDPHNWTDDSNGGTAGLYQINASEWKSLGGQAWNVGPHTPPPAGNNVWDPTTHLTKGIKLVCGHLMQMTNYLKQSGKKINPLDAMLVCHIAGCARVTGSSSGIPSNGEAGCGSTCVHLVNQYLGNVHDDVKRYSAR